MFICCCRRATKLGSARSPRPTLRGVSFSAPPSSFIQPSAGPRIVIQCRPNAGPSKASSTSNGPLVGNGGAGSPMFAANPRTSLIQLDFECVLAQVSVNGVWLSIDNFATLALRWRESHFLDVDDEPVALPTSRAMPAVAADFA